MMSWFTLLAILSLASASYLAALTLALHRKRRSSILRLCDEIGKPDAGRWITDHRDGALLAASLLRTIARIGFFMLILIDLTGVGEHATFTLNRLLIAGGVSVLALWLCTTVVAIPIAAHAGVGLIVRSLPFLRLCALLGTPLVKSLFFIDESIRRLSGANLTDDQALEDELLRSIEESSLEGSLEPEAAAMLENVVEFRGAEVSEVMTPRTDIEGIEYTDDITAIRNFIVEAGHSRIPVFRGNLDQIEGILYVKDLVPFLGADASTFTLEPLLRKPIVVPDTKAVPELLADFQQSEVHMAIVIDEYGGTSGLVTIEDVLEEIVGEIHDEHEPESDDEPTLTSIDERHAEVDGRYHIDDLNEQLNLELPEDDDYDTVAGFVLDQLGRVPSIGDSFVAHNARFTTIEATETHIQKILVELLEPTEANGVLSHDDEPVNQNEPS